MTTLRDALTEALSKSETGSLEPVPDAPAIEEAPQETPVETPTERARDEQGRFAKQEAQPPEPQVPQEPKPVRKPPSSWKKDYWGHWDKLATDPELAKLQDYIEEREQQAANGVHQYKSQLDQYKPVIDVLQKFQPELQQHNIQPQQWLENLGQAHRILALGTPEQKLQMMTWLASQYGIDPASIQSGQPNQQFGQIWNQAQTAEQKAAQALEAVKRFEQAQVQAQIDAFKQNAPHFDAVKATMGQLLDSGVAQDLQSAYEKAIRLHDDIWQQQQAEQRAAEEAKRQADIAKKKAAAASPKSNGPTGAAVTGGGKKDLHSLLSEAYDNAVGGRL